jgi:hypothetical protein
VFFAGLETRLVLASVKRGATTDKTHRWDGTLNGCRSQCHQPPPDKKKERRGQKPAPLYWRWSGLAV